MLHKCTHMLFSSHDSTEVSCQAGLWCVRLSACSTWPVCDKGMWSALGKKKKGKEKAFKVVFGVPALHSQQAADFL